MVIKIVLFVTSTWLEVEVSLISTLHTPPKSPIHISPNLEWRKISFFPASFLKAFESLHIQRLLQLTDNTSPFLFAVSIVENHCNKIIVSDFWWVVNLISYNRRSHFAAVI